MDYQQLLIYYLTSAEWDTELTMFFEGWKHCYDLYEGTPDYGKVYPCSEVYLEYERKMAATGGSYPNLRLTEQQFQKYFNKQYSSSQRFSVLFGLWWGLNESQIRRIADPRQKKNCLCWLHYFLCRPDGSPDISVDALRNFRYSGRYFAKVYDQPVKFTPPQQPKLVPFEEVESPSC